MPALVEPVDWCSSTQAVVRAVLIVEVQPSAQPADFGQHMMGGSGLIFGPFMMLTGVAILMDFIVLIVRFATKMAGDSKPEDNALEILRERFARGQIRHAEFLQMKRNLDAESFAAPCRCL